MGYQIIRELFLLPETVWMLYRYVNKISFQQDLSEHRYVSRKSVDEAMTRRMYRLQEVVDAVCEGIDPQAPAMRRFFANQTVDTMERVDTCLAALMTFPFCTMEKFDFRENLEEIRNNWHQVRARGGWIIPDSGNLLQFCDAEEEHGDLFDQVRALNLPAEFRLEIYDALRNFDAVLDELAELLEPIAQKLAKRLEKEQWLLEEPLDYWEDTFVSTAPSDFLRKFMGAEGELAETMRRGDWVIGVSLMLSKNLMWHCMEESLISPMHNYLYIGCAIDATKQRGNREDRLEQISVILKFLGDKKRLEILQRLSRESSYCYELADQMNVDYGNLSRTLSTLHSYGFLRQKRGPSRNYYETDLEAIHDFLLVVESVITK